MLPLLPIDLTFRTEAPWPGMVFTGSAWRGAFGHALKRTVCLMRQRPCEGCPIEVGCLYPSVFEPRPWLRPGRMARYTRAPAPFILLPLPASQGDAPCREQVRLRLTLVGHACRHLPYVLHAMAMAGTRGIGPRRTRLELVAAEAVLGPAAGDRAVVYLRGAHHSAPSPLMPTPPQAPTQVAITLPTPLRLSYVGAPRPIPLHHRAEQAQMITGLYFQLDERGGSGHGVC